MQQYHYKDQYRGKARTLLILMSDADLSCRIFCEGAFIGSMIYSTDVNAPGNWVTAYNILKPIAASIGQFIAQQMQQNQ